MNLDHALIPPTMTKGGFKFEMQSTETTIEKVTEKTTKKVTTMTKTNSAIINSSTSLDTQVKQTKKKQSIEVAVAVIHHQHGQYLLGYRNASQHQGEKYEFVGGKVEETETAIAGLIREVAEEINLDLTTRQCSKLGEIKHDYPEKQVCLYIFSVSLTDEQFADFQHKTCGAEGQPLVWVTKADLLANKYPLPEANYPILQWLAKDN